MSRCLLKLSAFAAICLSLAVFQPQHASAQVLKDVGKAIENTGKGIKETGKFIGEGVKKTGEAIEDGVKRTGDAISGDGENAAGGSDANSEDAIAATQVPTPQEKPVEKNFLFFQQADALSFADSKLTLTGLTQYTFFFTDRPVREAGHMSHKAYSELWNEGVDHGFKDNPPNAAIAIAGLDTEDPMVVELLSAELNGSEITYSVEVISGDIPAEAKEIALFVDLFCVICGK